MDSPFCALMSETRAPPTPLSPSFLFIVSATIKLVDELEGSSQPQKQLISQCCCFLVFLFCCTYHSYRMGRSDEVISNKSRRALFFAVPLPPGMMISGKIEKWDLYAKIKTFDSRYKIAFNVALWKFQNKSVSLWKCEQTVCTVIKNINFSTLLHHLTKKCRLPLNMLIKNMHA